MCVWFECLISPEPGGTLAASLCLNTNWGNERLITDAEKIYAHVRPPSAERRICSAAKKMACMGQLDGLIVCKPIQRGDSGVASPGWCVCGQSRGWMGAVFNCAEKHFAVVLPEKLQSACDQVVQYGINYPLECTEWLTAWLVRVYWRDVSAGGKTGDGDENKQREGWRFYKIKVKDVSKNLYSHVL